MFNNSKYTHWYNAIILKAKSQNRKKHDGIYYEKHHIIPKSLDGDNSKSNLVLLTAKEHFVCHVLLPKMCIDNDHKRRMVYAFFQMGKWQNVHHQRYNAKLYEIHKKSFIACISGSNSHLYENGFFGERNGMFGRKHSVESLAKMSENRAAVFDKEKQILCNPNRKPVTVQGIEFPSIRQAAAHFGVHKRVINRWCS
jgi:hypothetical protein